MNHIYRLVWNPTLQALVAVCECARGRGKSGSKASRTPALIAAVLMAACAMPAGAVAINALPTGGQVTAGTAAISSTANTLTVNQASQRAAINWQSFSVGSAATVNFVQPNSSSVILNRVVGTEQSVIAGALNANGQVFILNSNGVLFTGTSSVNVGGLVASTLNVSDTDFMAGRNTFTANGSRASVINFGTINAADGGYVALLGNQVKNEGVITAKLGTAILAAGDQISLNFNGDSLVGVTIDQGTLNALVENKQAIYADGGLVVLTAKGLDAVMATVVNNTGEIRAQTVENHEGKIYLLGGMDNNRIEVGGSLDASAPNGGNGGFIETSAAKVKIADAVAITTAAANGQQGQWLIDPVDFTIAASGGDITGSTISSLLAGNDVVIHTDITGNTPGHYYGTTVGTGNINVNEAISWSSTSGLSLRAYGDININANITSNSTGKLFLKYGQNGGPSTADYHIAKGVNINLQNGLMFYTTLGAGSQISYTVVNSAAALQNMNNTLAGNFALGSNVGLTGVTWTPIGNGSAAFTGKFDGLGHAVDHLAISTAIAGGDGIGLFGNVANATLKNIGVTNININAAQSDAIGGLVGSATDSTNIKNAYSTGSVTGNNWVGGLVGFFSSNGNLSTAILEKSNSTASVTGVEKVGGLVGYLEEVTTRNNSASGVVSASASAGGLFGYSYGSTINTSYASGNVTGTTDKVGGLIGDSDTDTIANVYAIGNITGASKVGGLLGAIGGSGSLTNGYASGVVTGTGADVGGLIGKIAYGTPVVTTSYWDTTTTGKSTSASSATGITNANAYTQASYTDFDFTSTGAWFSVNGYTRPFLRMEASNNIGNAHQLQLMSMNVGKSYILSNNIDLAPSLTNQSEMWKDNSASVNYSSYKGSFVPVTGLVTHVVGDPSVAGDGTFTGHLDGLNHTIDHLYIYRPTNSEIGLFAAPQGSTFKNIGLTNVDITGNGYVGGLAGRNTNNSLLLPTISNVYVTGAVKSIAVNSSFSGNTVGGLAGYSKGTISDSYSTATISGDVSSMGGLVGQNDATISRSYATGTVSGTGTASSPGGASENIGGLVGYNDAILLAGIIQDESYATGNVSGFNNVGGLVGTNGAAGTILNSHATGNVTGSGNYIGGLAGINSKTISTSYATGAVNGSTNVGGLVGTNGSTGAIADSYAEGTVTGTSYYLGGLAGSNYKTISGSHSISIVTGADYVGGLIGYNYGGVVSNNSYHTTGQVSGAQYVGGLIGKSLYTGNAISDSYSSGAVVSTGNGAGGLIGEAQSSTITDSYSSAVVSGGGVRTGGLIGNAGSVSVSRAYATGAVTGSSSRVGGLVGNDSAGHYSKTYATGAVDGGANDQVGGLVGYATNTHIDTSYATGTVHGQSRVGGLVGYMLEAVNTLENSYAIGAVTGTGTDTGGLVGTVENSTVTNAYSSGLTTGVANVGGLIGNSITSTITNSFWDTQTSGQVISSGGASVIGKTTAVMKTLATFSGTSPAWGVVIDPSLTSVYPQLRWATTGLASGSSVWVMGPAPASVSGSGSSSTTALANAVANAITAPQTHLPHSMGLPGSFLPTGGVAPGSGQPSAFVNVTNPPPFVSAAFGPGERFAVISSPGANEPTQGVTLSQARSMMQSPGQGSGGASDGDREVRVPVSRNSLADIVNGGVRLPNGVEQELFVVQAN